MNVEIMIEALKSKGKNQSQMAKDLGINIARISDMKVGRLFGYKYRLRISQYLGIDQDILFPEK